MKPKHSLSPEASQTLEWLGQQRARSVMRVRRIAFEDSREWIFSPGRAHLCHRGGRFFRVQGLAFDDPGRESLAMQPIINQPEIGILGVLVRQRHGDMELLLQAKAEPGNIGCVQLAPTVQATLSNYTRAHGGRPTKFIDHFLRRDLRSVVVDQLQSEQGSRFLKKRNRNMVLLVGDTQSPTTDEHFRWTTMSAVTELLVIDNLINSDLRSVLGCLNGSDTEPAADGRRLRVATTGSEQSQTYSIQPQTAGAEYSMAQVLAWLTDMRGVLTKQVHEVPIADLNGWRIEADRIEHESGRYFSVVQVAVEANDREVERWDQPLVSSVGCGMLALLQQERHGTPHYLVQARMEPGNFDGVELTATVHCTLDDPEGPASLPVQPFYERTRNAPPEHTLVRVRQSEEGGRFYQDANEYRIVEVAPTERIDHPPEYCWVTAEQLCNLVRFSNLLANELRTLVALLRTIPEVGSGSENR